MGFFYAHPEVAAAAVSGTPPICVFDTWLGDDFIRAQPLLLVTTPVMRAMRDLSDSKGFDFERARVQSSRFYRRYNAARRLPVFWQLRVDGVPGQADVGLTANGSLVVSQRVLDVLMRFRIGRAEFSQFRPTTSLSGKPEGS